MSSMHFFSSGDSRLPNQRSAVSKRVFDMSPSAAGLGDAGGEEIRYAKIGRGGTNSITEHQVADLAGEGSRVEDSESGT